MVCPWPIIRSRKFQFPEYRWSVLFTLWLTAFHSFPSGFWSKVKVKWNCQGYAHRRILSLGVVLRLLIDDWLGFTLFLDNGQTSCETCTFSLWLRTFSSSRMKFLGGNSHICGAYYFSILIDWETRESLISSVISSILSVLLQIWHRNTEKLVMGTRMQDKLKNTRKIPGLIPTYFAPVSNCILYTISIS